jgi:Protein of unknown function (DUF1194)
MIAASGRAASAFSAVACALAAVAWLVPHPPAGPRAQARVDLNLVLAIDCSNSVDAGEFALQVRGLANALSSPQVIEAIAEGPLGAIAVSVVQWSDEESQVVAVPWHIVGDEASARQLAGAVARLERLASGGATSISAMIIFGVALMQKSPTNAPRNVIDIAADGANNNGMRVDLARDLAVAGGIVINGLTIVNEVQYLQFYFRNHVIGGAGAFVELADDYADFERAIRQKLLREIKANVTS